MNLASNVRKKRESVGKKERKDAVTEANVGPGVPAEQRDGRSDAAGGRQGAPLPGASQQNAGPRTALRLSRRRLRPALLAQRRTHAPHPNPHR